MVFSSARRFARLAPQVLVTFRRLGLSAIVAGTLVTGASASDSDLVDGLTCAKLIKLKLLASDRLRACESVLKKAKAGDADSLYYTGLAVKGDGPSSDLRWRDAAQWLKRSADQGHVEAARALGLMHEQVYDEIYTLRNLYGEEQATVAKELLPHFLPANRFTWHRKAAEGGHPQSMEYVAKSYLTGSSGVGASKSAALEWYARAAHHYLDKWKRRDEALRIFDAMKEIDRESVYTLAIEVRLYGGPPAPSPGPNPPEKTNELIKT